MLSDLRPLTQDQRQEARQAAHDTLRRRIGVRPTREQFSQHAAGKFPPGVTRLITALCIVLLLAAFIPSAIRLYVIGADTFGQTVNNTAARTLVGVATVLSAEVGQVVFSLALATLGATRPSRRLLYTSMAIATGIALVGNIELADPAGHGSAFGWLEAIAPPLLVLSTAYVLKSQMLDAIQQRHANERAFQDALAAWAHDTSDPESHPQWNQFYANALRDALRRSNSRRKDVLAAMTTADWRAAVYREIQSEVWYEQAPVTEQAFRPTAPLAATVSGNGNGNGAH